MGIIALSFAYVKMSLSGVYIGYDFKAIMPATATHDSRYCTCLVNLGQCRHRHLYNIDFLMAHTACIVCFISTVNGRSKKKKKRSLF
jgi:hypothetical protein